MTEPGAELGAARLFADRYAREPEGVWRAPGRVNLIGEHTDYNDGFALPFAISAGVCVAAATRDDGVIALASRQHGDTVVTAPLETLAPGRLEGWPAYPAGVAWALLSAGHRVGGASLAMRRRQLPLVRVVGRPAGDGTEVHGGRHRSTSAPGHPPA